MADDTRVKPDLDNWIEEPVIRIRHERQANVEPAVLWAAARSIRLSDTRALGRLIRLRIPGTPSGLAYDQLFRGPPFTVLHEDESTLLSGLVGRIWTIRRDYPRLAGPDEFRHWSGRGTVRVLFALWTEQPSPERSTLVSETRVAPVDRRGRLGLLAVKPLIAASQSLIGSEALDVAVRRTKRAPGQRGGGA
jgi:hypothetical protein